MASGIQRLSGDEWQAWADHLLSRRYGPAQYQKVPAKDAGDAGIEGFTLSGHAYQAYGVQEPVTTKVRYEKQRDKLSDDIQKFKTNTHKLEKLLGDVIVSRWCFLVPYFDSKDLVAHAAKKTSEVKEAHLSYVGSDFRVMVSDEDEFAVERDMLLNAKVGTLHITAAPPSADTIQEWVAENDLLIQLLNAKLRRLSTLRTDAARRKFRDRLL